MGDTEISWTHRPGTRGRTWNPVQGCSRISAGCQNCYAERMAARFAETGWSQGLINIKNGKWNGTVRAASHKLLDPIRWRQPSTVFVNSMSDLFHEDMPIHVIDDVVAVMMICVLREGCNHLFQTLTKRPAKMRAYFSDPNTHERVARRAGTLMEDGDGWFDMVMFREGGLVHPNLWWGTSVENQDAADERIPELLRTPAAVRFLSCEPLLGAVDLDAWIKRVDHCGSCNAKHLPQADDRCLKCGATSTLISTWGDEQYCRYLNGTRYDGPLDDGPRLSWVIAGCESGPGARSCDVAWLRALRDQCASAGVAFFLKQAADSMVRERCDDCGEQIRAYVTAPKTAAWSCGCTTEGAEDGAPPFVAPGDGSKRKPGGVIELPYLDGVQHAAFPEVRHG